MIKTFADKTTAAVFQGLFVKSLPKEIALRARSKLRLLNAAVKVDDLKAPPANRLEKLSGNRAGQWSIRINEQWRICFKWESGHAYDAEIVDYH